MAYGAAGLCAQHVNSGQNVVTVQPRDIQLSRRVESSNCCLAACASPEFVAGTSSEIDGICMAAIRRLYRRGGVKFIGGGIYAEARSLLELYIHNVLGASYGRAARASRRASVTAVDIAESTKDAVSLQAGLQQEPWRRNHGRRGTAANTHPWCALAQGD
jgi:histone H3/H4